jgi:hypothetical protein
VSGQQRVPTLHSEEPIAYSMLVEGNVELGGQHEDQGISLGVDV